jgi:hypothetical protein
VLRTETGRGFWATVRDVRTAGAVTKIELTGETDVVIRVELARDEMLRLQPRTGESVYLVPRQLRVFVKEPRDGSGQAR